MNAHVSLNVNDLSETGRKSIEALIGAPLAAHQRVHIVVDDPPTGPPETTRLAAAERIRRIVDQAGAHAEAVGTTEEEINLAVGEAAAAVRPRN